jgi:hypothetical protein
MSYSRGEKKLLEIHCHYIVNTNLPLKKAHQDSFNTIAKGCIITQENRTHR